MDSTSSPTVVYAVIDTNVLVSALWTHNPLAATRLVLDSLLDSKVTPLYNDGVIAEYKDVLNRGSFPFDKGEVKDLIEYICEVGIDTDRTPFDEVMPDESDRVFYEISLTVEESFLVTGNLKHYPKVPKVITPAQFMEIFYEILVAQSY